MTSRPTGSSSATTSRSRFPVSTRPRTSPSTRSPTSSSTSPSTSRSPVSSEPAASRCRISTTHSTSRATNGSRPSKRPGAATRASASLTATPPTARTGRSTPTSISRSSTPTSEVTRSIEDVSKRTGIGSTSPRASTAGSSRCRISGSAKATPRCRWMETSTAVDCSSAWQPTRSRSSRPRASASRCPSSRGATRSSAP